MLLGDISSVLPRQSGVRHPPGEKVDRRVYGQSGHLAWTTPAPRARNSRLAAAFTLDCALAALRTILPVGSEQTSHAAHCTTPRPPCYCSRAGTLFSCALQPSTACAALSGRVSARRTLTAVPTQRLVRRRFPHASVIACSALPLPHREQSCKVGGVDSASLLAPVTPACSARLRCMRRPKRSFSMAGRAVGGECMAAHSRPGGANVHSTRPSLHAARRPAPATSAPHAATHSAPAALTPLSTSVTSLPPDGAPDRFSPLSSRPLHSRDC